MRLHTCLSLAVLLWTAQTCFCSHTPSSGSTEAEYVLPGGQNALNDSTSRVSRHLQPLQHAGANSSRQQQTSALDGLEAAEGAAALVRDRSGQEQTLGSRQQASGTALALDSAGSDLGHLQLKKGCVSLDPGRIWLYAHILTDFGGHTTLPHFIEHYTTAGIPAANFIVLLHHDPLLPGASDRTVEQAANILQAKGLYYRTFRGPSTPAVLMQVRLRLLGERVRNPHDWVVAVDGDEFLELVDGADIRGLIEAAEGQGATWIRGHLVERVSERGRLSRVQPASDLRQLFPLACRFPRRMTGRVLRAIAAKAYLRINDGGGRVVRPSEAAWYFGACGAHRKPSGGSGLVKACPEGNAMQVPDLYNSTPYRWHSKCYSADESGAADPDRWDAISPLGGWAAVRASFEMTISHLKWHSGAAELAAARAKAYSGDCQVGSNERECSPVESSWRDAAAVAAHLRAHQGRLGVAGFTCLTLEGLAHKQEQELQQQQGGDGATEEV